MADDYIKMALVAELKKLASIFYAEDQLKKQQNELQRLGFKQIMKIHSLVEVSDDLPSNAKAIRLIKWFQHQGLTWSVRQALIGMGEWMSPGQVRDLLVRLRIDLTKYKTPLGSINTILTRLAEDGYAETMTDRKTGKTLFRWKEPEYWTEAEIEEYPESMLQPPKRKRKGGKKKIAAASQKLLTEGSLKVD